MKAASSYRVILLTLIISAGLNTTTAYTQVADAGNNIDGSQTISSRVKKEERKAGKKEQPAEQLMNWFQCFTPSTNASYTIKLCADLPDNDHPDRIHLKNEPGHVFIILSKKDSVDSCSITFGFYPRKPVSSLFFKKVRSKILESHSREYEVSVCKTLSPAEFQVILQKAAEFSVKKYDLNKYNCYNYALEVFNAIPGIEKIPETKAKFPFPFGRGGSPCCLYHDLQELKEQSDFWRQSIQFGQFHSPPNCRD